MFNIIIALLILSTHVSSGLHGALLEYPDGTTGECTLEAFHAFMGKTTSPHDVSSLEKTKEWWLRERDYMLQNTLDPDHALFIMIDKHQQWIIDTFPRWAKVADISEYDKLPNLNNDLPNAKHWRKVISGMIALSALHEIAEIPNASKIFTMDYQPDKDPASHQQRLIVMLDSFPENFNDNLIDEMLFVVNNFLRYTKVQLVAMFCDQLIFPIPSFLTGLYEGRLIFPVTLHFQNSHKWGAHQNKIIGLRDLLHHDFFMHGNSLLVAEQLGPALFDQPEDTPFLQSWTQYAFSQMLKTMENPHAYISVDKEFSFPRQCVSIANTSVALLFHGLHEVPSSITDPNYLDMPFITADKDLRDFNKTVFKDSVQNIDIEHKPLDEVRAYASMPVNHETLKNPHLLTRTCLKTWLNIEEESCSFQRMIQMFQAIKNLLASQHHKAAYATRHLFNIPFDLVVLQDCSVSCALFNGLTAMLVHDSHHSITLLIPDPSALSHITEHDARIALQSLRQVAFHVAQRSQSILVDAKERRLVNVGNSFFKNIFANASLREEQERALLYADDALSPITYGMGTSLCPGFYLQHFSNASAFQAFWTKWMHDANRLSSGGTGDEKRDWLDIISQLGKKCPAFPRIAQKESYNLPHHMKNAVTNNLYRILAFLSVQEILAKYTHLGVIDENVLQKMEQTLHSNPKRRQELLFLKNFPHSFLTQDLHMALFIIEQLSIKIGLEVYVVETDEPTMPPIQFLAALHEGIILLPAPTTLVEGHLWSSHNGQYHGLPDILIKREILGYLQAMLLTENKAQYLYPDHPKPFLQYWVRERMNKIQQNMIDKQGELFDMGQHLDPNKATAHATLAELLRLYQEIHESTLIPNTRTSDTPSALDDDNNFMILAQSIFGPLLEPQFSPTDQVRFIKDYLTRTSPHLAKINALS